MSLASSSHQNQLLLAMMGQSSSPVIWSSPAHHSNRCYCLMIGFIFLKAFQHCFSLLKMQKSVSIVSKPSVIASKPESGRVKRGDIRDIRIHAPPPNAMRTRDEVLCAATPPPPSRA